MSENEITFWQKTVGISFNPSGLTKVDELKLNYASWICHPDNNVLKTIQNILSEKIRKLITSEKVDMFVRKLSLQGTQDGFLKLEDEKVKFVNLEKNVLFEKKYSELISWC